MGLQFVKLNDPGANPAAEVEAEERLWLTADKEGLVADGDPKAAFLFCSPGDMIQRKDALRYGLLDGPAEEESEGAGAEKGLEPEPGPGPEPEPEAEPEPPSSRRRLTRKKKPEAKKS